MARVVPCPECGKRLKVPDNFSHPRAKCPNCAEWLSLVEEETPKPIPPPTPAPARKPEGPDDRYVFAQEEVDPKKRKSLYDEEEARPRREAREEDEQSDRPRKKRRKRRPKEEPGEGMSPALKWWLALGGCGVLLILVGLVVELSGHPGILLDYGIGMLILIPITTIILILSMVLSSHFAGGIDFGEIHIVVPKAILLILVMDAISLLPVGGMFAKYVFPFILGFLWLLGLMYFFDLDFWEARFLVILNWGLNYVVHMFLVTMLISHMTQDAQSTKPGIPDRGRSPILEWDDPE